MTAASALARTELPLKLHRRGKVRDVYEIDAERLLLVATDRISAFDVVLPQPIPFKGQVLTQLTAWWLSRLPAAAPHHLISAQPDEIARAVPLLAASYDTWAGRSMLVRRTRVVPIECVVRGYISGSAWQEYRARGSLASEPLPQGLRESERLDPPIFSPATKAEHGHDENITFAAVAGRVGAGLAETLRERSLALYAEGGSVAEQVGIIVADTKFEFGQLADGTLLLIDEVLTPDSSRFWPAASYQVGRGQPSLDKQPVRDYLETLVTRGAWQRAPPAPELPAEVVAATSERYREVFRQLTGVGLEEFMAGRTPQAPPKR